MGWARKPIEMEMDVFDSDDGRDLEDDGPPPPSGSDPSKLLGNDTMASLQALSMDLKSVHIVLIQVLNLASGSCWSKDSALAGLHSDISQACRTLQRLRTRLEVGRVSHSVQESKAEKNKLEKEITKLPSYAEVARRGQ